MRYVAALVAVLPLLHRDNADVQLFAVDNCIDDWRIAMSAQRMFAHRTDRQTGGRTDFRPLLYAFRIAMSAQRTVQLGVELLVYRVVLAGNETVSRRVGCNDTVPGGARRAGC